MACERQPQRRWYADHRQALASAAAALAVVVAVASIQQAAAVCDDGDLGSPNVYGTNFPGPPTPSANPTLAPYPLNTVPDEELYALVALHNATAGELWSQSWFRWAPIGNIAFPPCAWYGVVCRAFPDGLHVVELNLPSNNLGGTLPDSLGQLRQAYRLDLSGNAIAGTIPSRVQWFKRLKYLKLADNQLAGAIPSTLGTMTTLRQLYLNSNHLNGTVPDALTTLQALRVLNVSDNWLTGSHTLTVGAFPLLQFAGLETTPMAGDPRIGMDTRLPCNPANEVLSTITQQ